MKFTAEDRKLLKSMGIDPGAPDAEDFLVIARRFPKKAKLDLLTQLTLQKLVLAHRIAKHPAPAQVKLDPQAAKIQLIRLAAKKLLDNIQ